MLPVPHAVWLQPVALALPPTHVFEGMRGVLKSGVVDWGGVWVALALNAIFLAAAAAFFARMLSSVRRRGLLVKVATQ